MEGVSPRTWIIITISTPVIAVLVTYLLGGFGSPNPVDDSQRENPVDYSQREGTYTGTSSSEATNSRGVASLTLEEIVSPHGKSEAFVEWDGPPSRGYLYGSINEDGELDLSGDVYGCMDQSCTSSNAIYDTDLQRFA